MGLKCSVLGHKYGDASVERDREEQGSEVVITIREIETCGRCGEDRIVSENKEVTSIATPDEQAGTGDATTESTGASADDAAVRAGESDGAGDAAVTDRSTSTDDGEPADSPADPRQDVASSDDDARGAGAGDGSAPVDTNEGVEILDAESTADVTDDELADPSIDDAGLGSDPVADDPPAEDAVIVDDDEDDDAGERAPGEWPDEPDGDDDGWNPNDALEDDEPITAPDAGTDRNNAVTVPDGDFRCPECGYTTSVDSSSLRAGDFCPECHKGSLVHEPGTETRKE